MRIIKFEDMPNEDWDRCVDEIRESTYLHTSWWINYLNAINGKENSRSFIIFDGNKPIAICPLAICKVDHYGISYTEATFKGTPGPYPSIINLPPMQRRRTMRKVCSVINGVLKQDDTKRVEFFKHVMSLSVLDEKSDLINMAEAISTGYLPYIKNTIILDLKKEENRLLSEMSKYQRKHIKKSEKQGIKIKEYAGHDKNVAEAFNDFKSAHFKSAGRLTRPLESWQIMKELLMSNKASLFVASIDSKNMSYLYCGEFNKFSFGWSQVNLDEYEEEYSPRHLLEWEAARSYKKKGFHYYEVGIKYDSPQFNYVPTTKEVSISQMKERYGGDLFCHFYFEKFFDKDLFSLVYEDRVKRFLSSDYFSLEKDNPENGYEEQE